MTTTSRDQDESGWDFLLERQLPIGVEAIVTNPPFNLAAQFVAHALDLAPRWLCSCRLAFLESERRTPILDGGRLARVHVFEVAVADDAPRRMARTAGTKLALFRLVGLASRSSRPGRAAPTCASLRT